MHFKLKINIVKHENPTALIKRYFHLISLEWCDVFGNLASHERDPCYPELVKYLEVFGEDYY